MTTCVLQGCAERATRSWLDKPVPHFCARHDAWRVR